MNPVKVRLYTERIEKEKRYEKLNELFVPIPRSNHLAVKFYARHDTIPASDVNQQYIDLITKRMISTPKQIYSFRPPTVNMEYGWFPDLLLKRSLDPRLYFPKKQSDFISQELEIRKQQKGLPVEKFTGIPFKV